MGNLIKFIVSIVLIVSIFPVNSFAKESTPVHTLSEEQQNFYNTALKSMINIESRAKFNPQKISYLDALNIVDQVVKENPEIFYYNEVSASSDGTIEFKYSLSKKTILQKKNKIDAAVKKVVASIIKKNMSDLDKVKAIHDYLVLNVAYDYKNSLKGTVPLDSYEIYGSLINKKAVCDGYSKLMQVLLKKVGISSTIVVGTANGENHSWNLVELNGKYYHLDATWDDPAPDKKGVVNYKYFLLTDKQMKKDHRWIENNYPTATSGTYNYFHNMENMIEKSGYYYYSNAQNDILYKMNKKSKKVSKVVSDRAPYFAIYGEWIYYSNYSNSGYLYKVKLNGKSKKIMIKKHVVDIYTKGRVLIYKEVKTGKVRQLVL